MTSVIEPVYRTGYVNINPQVYTNKYSPFFKSTSTNTYIADDPRLIDVMRGGYKMQLDRPPIDSCVCDVNSPVLNIYGKPYHNYKDIHEGQIMYYVDNSIKDPYFEPVFFNKAFITKNMYTNPMGLVTREYNRTPLNTKKQGLSFINDSTEFREELMSLQMRTINAQKYMPHS
jgi:hypothetical protein